MKLFKETAGLPEDDPITWLEVHKRALGQKRYVLRATLLLTVPILIVAGVMIVQYYHRGAWVWRPYQNIALASLMFGVWGLCALAIVVSGVHSIAGERSSKTLDVLLTTPMRGVDIVRQKYDGLKRPRLLFWIPLLSVYLLQMWTASISPRWSFVDGFLVIGFAALTIAVYMRFLSWYGLWMGLKIQSRTRAMVTAIVALLAWCVTPLFGPLKYLTVLSFGPAAFGAVVILGLVNTVFHYFVGTWCARPCRVHADQLLGRPYRRPLK